MVDVVFQLDLKLGQLAHESDVFMLLYTFCYISPVNALVVDAHDRHAHLGRELPDSVKPVDHAATLLMATGGRNEFDSQIISWSTRYSTICARMFRLRF